MRYCRDDLDHPPTSLINRSTGLTQKTLKLTQTQTILGQKTLYLENIKIGITKYINRRATTPVYTIVEKRLQPTSTYSNLNLN